MKISAGSFVKQMKFNVQIIHNSPYPVVDIYVDDAEALGDVPFRATTGMIQLPTSTTVGIAPANGDVIANFPFTLETNANYVVSASGILGSDATPFGLVASGLELAAVDTNHFGLKVFHGVTDAPAVDIYANGNLLVENLGYNEYKGFKCLLVTTPLMSLLMDQINQYPYLNHNQIHLFL